MLIVFMKTPDAPVWQGFFIACLMFATAFTQNALHQHLFYMASQVAFGMRATLIAAVYRKALCISPSATQRTTVGEMVNLMAVDIHRIQEYNHDSWMVWSGPLVVTIALVLLYRFPNARRLLASCS